jgi:DNA-binding response OmpR family regulator
MLKVMLVEDDPTMVSLLTTLLSLEGFHVMAPKNHHRDSLLKATTSHFDGCESPFRKWY